MKTYFRIIDNNNINANDKWVNLRAMFSPVSEKFIQFRLFKKAFEYRSADGPIFWVPFLQNVY